MSSDRSPISDEDLARRLQYQEQVSKRNVGTTLYTPQELVDLELAKYYANLNMNGTSSHSVQSTSQTSDVRRIHSNQQHHNRSECYPENYYLPPLPSIDQYYSNNNNTQRTFREAPRYYNSPNRHHGKVLTKPSTTRDPFDYSNMDNNTYNSQHQNFLSPHHHKRSTSTNLSTLSPQERQFRPIPLDSSNHTMSSPGNMTSNNSRESTHFAITSAKSLACGVARRHNENSTSDGTKLWSQTENNDLELARRMQDLENRGMGRMNSDRNIETMDDTNHGSEIIMDDRKFSPRKSSDFEALAKLISESGANINEISDEVLNELLGESTSRENRKAQISSELMNGSKSTNGYPNREIIQSKASPISPQKLSKSIPQDITIDAMDDNVSTMTTSAAVTQLDTNAKNKTKRRGFFGFHVASKNRLDVNDVVNHDPPITAVDSSGIPPDNKELIVDWKRKPNVTSNGGVPAAIPPPPPPGGSIYHTSSNPQRQTRSMSPSLRPNNNTNFGGIPAPTSSFPIPRSTISGIPDAIPPKPVDIVAPRPGNSFHGLYRGTNVCVACGLSHGTFLKVLDRKYHPECFRCSSCNGKIDPNDQFKYTTDEQGRICPFHRECFLCFGVHCYVCKSNIPVTPDGRVPYIKHPFFDTELMCVRHADEQHRRCCGCHRLEPYDAPFIDLMDGNRGVCTSCCQTIIVDSSEATPIWRSVLQFLEKQLNVPIWNAMRDIPIIILGSESLNKQMDAQGSIHGIYTQIMASGLCLIEHGQQQQQQQQRSEYNNSGFQNHVVPSSSSTSNTSSISTTVIAILCLTGLPRAFVAGILAHEAIHTWMVLHPKYDVRHTLPTHVEEGLCQLFAALFLSDGVIPNVDIHKQVDTISEKKLRQYYKFTIERDKSDIYGSGYRSAAMAYSEIGMEALLSYVMEYREFPQHASYS